LYGFEVALGSGRNIYSLRSNGDGTFNVRTFRPWAGYAIPNALWMTGDFNGDGRADVLHAVHTANYIHFSIFSHSEQSEACGANAEGYVIDTHEDWVFIKDKIKSDKITHEPNLENSRLLVYLFGQRRFSGNKFAINKIEGIPATQSIFVSIDFADGNLDALSCPYLIITIPKTGHRTVVFGVNNVPFDSPHLVNLAYSK
jgi:hypothetical protein